MRRSLFLLLFIVGCSSKEPERNIASENIMLGEVNLSKSLVQIFPSETSTKEDIRDYVFIQLKDSKGRFVDCNPSEISIKTSKGKSIHFYFHRFLVGRYYLTLKKSSVISSEQLEVFVRGTSLQKKLKLHTRYPHISKSKITLIKRLPYKIIFQLKLADEMNMPITLSGTPEIMIEGGQGAIEETRRIREGTWEFTLIYPEDNQIIYLSVRADGAFLSNIFRFQHVEK